MNAELDSEQTLLEEWAEMKRTHIVVTMKQFLRVTRWTYSKFNREAKAGRLAVIRGNGHPKIRVEEVARVLGDPEEGEAA